MRWEDREKGRQEFGVEEGYVTRVMIHERE